MTTETQEKGLAKTGAQGLEKALAAFKIEDIQPESIKRYICADATDQEIMMFIYACRQLKLNPFLKQIYLVKYGGKAQTIINFKEYLKKAYADQTYRGYTVAEIMEGPKITGARCVIYFKDNRMPFEWVAWMDENNKKQSSWLTQPRLMIRKCAIKQAHDYALAHVYGDFSEYEIAEQSEITEVTDSQPRHIAQPGVVDEKFYSPGTDEKLENQPENGKPEEQEIPFDTPTDSTVSGILFATGKLENGKERVREYIKKNYGEIVKGSKSLDEALQKLDDIARQTIAMAIGAKQL